MKDFEIKSLLIAFNSAVFILALTGFCTDRNHSKARINQLCFKYAAKKCNFLNKGKAKLICNTLVNHNSSISAIKHHKECRKDK